MLWTERVGREHAPGPERAVKPGGEAGRQRLTPGGHVRQVPGAAVRPAGSLAQGDMTFRQETMQFLAEICHLDPPRGRLVYPCFPAEVGIRETLSRYRADAFDCQ